MSLGRRTCMYAYIHTHPHTYTHIHMRVCGAGGGEVNFSKACVIVIFYRKDTAFPDFFVVFCRFSTESQIYNADFRDIHLSSATHPHMYVGVCMWVYVCGCMYVCFEKCMATPVRRECFIYILQMVFFRIYRTFISEHSFLDETSSVANLYMKDNDFV